MTLAEYLKSTKTRQADYAARLGVSVSRVSRLVSRSMDPSFELARRIVAESGGKVTLEELAILEPSVPAEAGSYPAQIGA